MLFCKVIVIITLWLVLAYSTIGLVDSVFDGDLTRTFKNLSIFCFTLYFSTSDWVIVMATTTANNHHNKQGN